LKRFALGVGVGRGIKRCAFSGFFQAAGLDAKRAQEHDQMWGSMALAASKNKRGLLKKIMDWAIGV
jgi:hypothetical protein